jgi:hypothetical protein
MANPMSEAGQKQRSDELDRPWTRFWLGLLAGGCSTFAWCYFASPAKSFGESVLAGTVIGLLFGLLSAVFGRRVLDFLMSII